MASNGAVTMFRGQVVKVDPLDNSSPRDDMHALVWWLVAIIDSAAYESPELTSADGAFWRWWGSRQRLLWISHRAGPNA